MGHPGKKLLFMRQEHCSMQNYVKALNQLYTSSPALYEMDHEPEGFEWINCTYEAENIIAFSRRGRCSEEVLLFVCNFGDSDTETFRVGVPFAGTWMEVLNSDEERFGGDGRTNPQEKPSEPEEKDNRKQSIAIRLAPRSICVFSYKKEEDAEQSMPEKQETEEIESAGKGRSKLPTLPIHPAKTAKAAGEAIAQKGADALDKLSETVGRIIKKK
jgi:1,4-alpha-glucan branching enzyme